MWQTHQIANALGTEIVAQKTMLGEEEWNRLGFFKVNTVSVQFILAFNLHHRNVEIDLALFIFLFYILCIKLFLVGKT